MQLRFKATIWLRQLLHFRSSLRQNIILPLDKILWQIERNKWIFRKAG